MNVILAGLMYALLLWPFDAQELPVVVENDLPYEICLINREDGPQRYAKIYKWVDPKRARVMCVPDVWTGVEFPCGNYFGHLGLYAPDNLWIEYQRARPW